MTADAIQLRSVAARVARIVWIRRNADRLKPLLAAIQNVCHAAQGFHVVDNCGLAEQTFDRRKRRLNTRPCSLAFQTFDQTGFFTADVCTSTTMQHNIQIEACALDVLAQQTCCVTFLDRGIQSSIAAAILIAKVEIGVVGFDRMAGNHDAFDQLMRILFHQDSIVEGSRFAFIGVDAQINRTWMILGQEGPFQAARKTRAAAPTQASVFDDVNDIDRSHAQDLFDPRVATVGHVCLQ